MELQPPPLFEKNQTQPPPRGFNCFSAPDRPLQLFSSSSSLELLTVLLLHASQTQPTKKPPPFINTEPSTQPSISLLFPPFSFSLWTTTTPLPSQLQEQKANRTETSLLLPQQQRRSSAVHHSSAAPSSSVFSATSSVLPSLGRPSFNSTNRPATAAPSTYRQPPPLVAPTSNAPASDRAAI